MKGVGVLWIREGGLGWVCGRKFRLVGRVLAAICPLRLVARESSFGRMLGWRIPLHRSLSLRRLPWPSLRRPR